MLLMMVFMRLFMMVLIMWCDGVFVFFHVFELDVDVVYDVVYGSMYDDFFDGVYDNGL